MTVWACTQLLIPYVGAPPSVPGVSDLRYPRLELVILTEILPYRAPPTTTAPTSPAPTYHGAALELDGDERGRVLRDLRLEGGGEARLSGCRKGARRVAIGSLDESDMVLC